MERIDLRSLEDVLGIYSPWSIKSARLNEQDRILDVHLELADRRRLFGLFNVSKESEHSEPGSWIYITLGKYRVVTHAQIPGTASQGSTLNYSSLNQACFLGNPGRKYSNFLRYQVASAKSHGLSAELIAELYQLERTVVDSIFTDLSHAPSQVQSLACLAPETHPLWEKILRGSVALDPQVLPLKLLLTKLKMAANSGKKEELQQSVLELRKFFVANASILGTELAQIFGIGAKTPAKSAPVQLTETTNRLVLPGLGNPVWIDLLANKIQVSSASVPLNLLISRQKALFAHARQASERLAAIEVVREYFLKNHRTLKAELLLLNRACAIREKNKFRLPEANHNIWQQILQDDSLIPSDHIAYKLLLARLRSQLKSEPSPAVRLDAAKRIREFIKQNHKSMKQELAYLFKFCAAA